MFNFTTAQFVSFSTSTRLRGLIIALAFFICLTAANSSNAATFTVINTADSGAGSLRQAVLDANATIDDDIINFNIPAATDAGCVEATGVCTITLASEITITVNGSLTINGTGADLLTIDGGGTSRIFSSTTAIFTLSGATLTNGFVAGNGGAILADGGTTVLESVFIQSNTSNFGGGVFFQGGADHRINDSTFNLNSTTEACGGGFAAQGSTLTVTNSTFSGNSGFDAGGGFCNVGSTVTVRNTTITNNTGGSDFGGGGIFMINSATTNIGNTINAGNTAPLNADFSFNDGTLISAGYNLVGDNTSVETQFPAGNPNANNDFVGTAILPVLPLLDPLADYGGPVPTHRLQAGSPAINNGNNALAVDADGAPLLTDQRGAGFPRIVGSVVDIGAFESPFVPTAAEVSISGRVSVGKNTGLRNAVVIMTDMQGITRTARTSSFGYYRFDGVEAGQTYIVSVASKSFQFAPQVVSVFENVEELNFTAEP